MTYSSESTSSSSTTFLMPFCFGGTAFLFVRAATGPGPAALYKYCQIFLKTAVAGENASDSGYIVFIVVTNCVMGLRPDVQFFKELTLQWMNAWKQRDRAILDRLLSENFNFISKTKKGLCMDKTEWLRMALEIYQLDNFEVDFISITIYEHTGVVVYKIIQDARPNYTGEPEAMFVTDVWSADGEQWKAISRQPMPV